MGKPKKGEKAPLESFEIAVEFLLIFMENDLTYFCEKDLAKMLESRKIPLQKKRIYQFLHGFEAHGKLISESRPANGSNGQPTKETKYYRLSTEFADKLLPNCRIPIDQIKLQALAALENQESAAPAEAEPETVELKDQETHTNGDTPKAATAPMMDEWEILVKRAQNASDKKGDA